MSTAVSPATDLARALTTAGTPEQAKQSTRVPGYPGNGMPGCHQFRHSHPQGIYRRRLIWPASKQANRRSTYRGSTEALTARVKRPGLFVRSRPMASFVRVGCDQTAFLFGDRLNGRIQARSCSARTRAHPPSSPASHTPPRCPERVCRRARGSSSP